MKTCESEIRSQETGGSLRKWLRRLTGRFQVQLMLPFLGVVAVMAILISILFYQSIEEVHRERQERLLTQQAESHLKLLESRVSNVEADARSILSNTTIKDYLTYPYLKPATKIQDALYSFQPLVRWVANINRWYKRIHFLTASPYTAGDPYVNSLDDFMDREWVRDTIDSPTHSLWQNSHELEYIRYTLNAPTSDPVATYTLYNSTGKHMVVLDTDASWLYQGIPLVTDAATARVLFSSAEPEAVGENLVIRPGEMPTVSLNGREYFVYGEELPRLGVKVYSCAEKTPFLIEIWRQMGMFMLTTTAYVFAALVLLFISSRSVVRRMSVIGRNVSTITMGNYEVDYQVTRNDEIDDIGTKIVEMAGQMDEMVNQRLNQEMLLKESEFRALQQQINPHFIFNILQTMQMLAEMNDQTELADMIAKFGRMVRYNLYASMNVPLQEEVENVCDYLMLQKVMFNDELEMDVRMDGMPSALEVPRLLLQPLVENAVHHGRVKGRVLHIELAGEMVAGGVCIRVRNDGQLLSPETETELTRVLNEVCQNPGSVDGANAKSNLALINIQKRLLVRFGSRCRLKIGNDGDGVLVTFTIPWKERTA